MTVSKYFRICVFVVCGIGFAGAVWGQSCPVIAPTSQSVDSTAQTLPVQITAATSCFWSATGLPAWITGASAGMGNGDLALTIMVNTTGADRTASIAVNGTPVAITQAFTPQTFTDVAPGTYYFDAVNLLSSNGVTSGCGPNVYCPGETVTRDQMAVFLVKSILGTGTFTYSPNPYFNDVPNTYWAFPWIQKLYELGVTAGCQAQPLVLYCPTETVARDQMAIFIIRARFGAATIFTYLPTPFFTDVPDTYPSFDWIQRLRQDDITSGCGNATYCPASPVYRGDMAIFLMRGAFNQLLPAGLPTLTGLTPAVIANGDTKAITLTGVNTNFIAGATEVHAVPDLVVNSVAVTSPTTLIASVTVNTDISVLPLSIWITDPTEDIVLPNALLVEQPLITSFTTGYYYDPISYTVGNQLILGLSPQIYTLNDGSTWSSGAGSFGTGMASVTASTVTGNVIQFSLTMSPDPLFEFTDFDSGSHSAQGSFGAAGPLTLVASIGSTTAVLSGYLLLESNTSTSYPTFNYFSAPVGSLVPFSVTFTLFSGTWSTDTFNADFSYSVAGQVTFPQ